MKIFFSRDMMNKDPEKRDKIIGIIVEAGHSCRYACWCPHGHECKYRAKYTFHNLCCKIQTFFQYRLGWKWFRIPIYFQKHDSDMSGTTMCPKHLPRHKDCWTCKYHVSLRECNNKQRHQMIREGRYRELDCEEHCCCSLFEPVEWFNDYDKKTGDPIF